MVLYIPFNFKQIVTRIIGIDPGIVHLGVVWCDVINNKIYSPGASCVNLTEYCNPCMHARVHFDTCELNHTSHLYDRLAHFFQEWRHDFEKADIIAVELQPHGSAGYPFELILREKYGSKCYFVRPSELHSHFMTRQYSYNTRKIENERIARDWLTKNGHSVVWHEICFEKRQHDCADAILMIMYYLDNKDKPTSVTGSNTHKSRKSRVYRSYNYKQTYVAQNYSEKDNNTVKDCALEMYRYGT